MLDDYELLYLANENNEDAINELFNKYSGLIYYKAIKYSESKKYIDDYVNEGFLCLYEAIHNYIESNDIEFIKYLNTYLERKMINCKKSFNRKKHSILNNALSLEDNYTEIDKYLIDKKSNPETILEESDEYNSLRNKILNKLDNNEELVFILREQNFSVKEIANIIDMKLNEIYNIIKSIRTKIIKNV